MATFGYWEVRQAERFRTGTKETAKELTKGASEIERTTQLNEQDALEEFAAMRGLLAMEGKTLKGASGEDIDVMSEAITGAKQTHNEKVQERLVNEAEEELHRRLEKYRDEFGKVGTEILSDPRRINAFREHVRAELKAMEDGRYQTDQEKFQRLIRGSIDPKYWRRYVYGGAEALIGFAGFKFALPKVLGWWYGTGVPVPISPGTPPAPGMPPSLEMNMQDTVWHSVKEWMKTSGGVANPTDAQVMELSKSVVTENGIGVAEWGISGSPMDTAMQQGHLLKFGKAKILYNAMVTAGKIAGHLIP